MLVLRQALPGAHPEVAPASAPGPLLPASLHKDTSARSVECLLPPPCSQSLELRQVLFVEWMSDFEEYNLKAVGCFKWEGRIISGNYWNILSSFKLLLL